MATMTTKPRITVREATPSDVEKILDVFYKAFGTCTMNRLMLPDGSTPSERAKFASRFFPPPSEPPEVGDEHDRKPKQGRLMHSVAVLEPPAGAQDEQGEIVSFARWTWNKEPREEWEWNVEKTLTAEDLGEGVDVDVVNAFIGGLKRKERHYARGDPHLVLNLLATDPARQGVGAGSALVRWGNDFADSHGIASFLEASPSGYPVYKRLGFESLDVLDLNIRELWNQADDGADWGVNSAVELAGPLPEGTFRSVIMRRLPRGV